LFLKKSLRSSEQECIEVLNLSVVLARHSFFFKKGLKPRGKAWYEKELKKAFRRDNV
jgi:hypothetical protein